MEITVQGARNEETNRSGDCAAVDLFQVWKRGKVAALDMVNISQPSNRLRDNIVTVL